MQITNPNSSLTNVARQNILEKANQAFSGGEKAEDFSKKISDALNSVAENQNKASEITKAYELGKETDLTKVIMQQQISSIAFQMTLNVRNKVLSSYKDIMNMPV
jgi:flagellar hook-basal body complex protein FliE